MAKALTIIGLTVACLMLPLFGLDLALGIPFSQASVVLDILFLLAAGLLGYMSWSAFRELR